MPHNGGYLEKSVGFWELARCWNRDEAEVPDLIRLTKHLFTLYVYVATGLPVKFLVSDVV